MKFEALKQETQKLIAQLGASQSEKFFKRVEEIVAILRKKYPITGIDMGMGCWYIEHGPVIFLEGFKEKDSEEWQFEEYENKDGLHYLISKGCMDKADKPKIYSEEDKPLMVELHDILDFLTDKPEMQIKDWKF